MIFNEKDAVDVNNHKRSCVYFIIENNEVVYVGKSKNGRKRIVSHVPEIRNDNVQIIKCNQKQLLELEDYYMMKYQPEYNIVINSCRKNLPSIYNKVRTKCRLSISEFADLLKEKEINTTFFKNIETISAKDYNKLKRHFNGIL